MMNRADRDPRGFAELTPWRTEEMDERRSRDDRPDPKHEDYSRHKPIFIPHFAPPLDDEARGLL